MKIITIVFLLAGLLSSPLGFAQENDIIEAAKSGDAEQVRLLLKTDPGLVRAVDGGLGATALHWALIYGQKGVIKAILTYNPDVNKTEAHNGTPMHWAAHFDDAENIQWLLDRGAKIDHVNQYGRTPLLVAARRGCIQVGKFLLDRGADIKAKVNDGSTALHIAAQNGHKEMMALFIDKGLDPGIKNDRGQTYKDVLFIRPETINLEPTLYSQYAGLYAPPAGPPLEIHLENDKLYYYAYGKDELCPISETRFITSAEVKYFEFVKDDEGNVSEVIYSSGSTKVRSKKIRPERS
ncbi:MAG: ankyrin repeat domain-containing protein [Candidatus Aminicenantes bacterium]|nr:ankyrin repeat domain-containing protein [Candidatus Aminicenantes bacterium]